MTAPILDLDPTPTGSAKSMPSSCRMIDIALTAGGLLITGALIVAESRLNLAPVLHSS